MAAVVCWATVQCPDPNYNPLLCYRTCDRGYFGSEICGGTEGVSTTCRSTDSLQKCLRIPAAKTNSPQPQSLSCKQIFTVLFLLFCYCTALFLTGNTSVSMTPPNWIESSCTSSFGGCPPVKMLGYRVWVINAFAPAELNVMSCIMFSTLAELKALSSSWAQGHTKRRHSKAQIHFLIYFINMLLVSPIGV